MRFQRSIWTFEAEDADTPHRAREAVRAFAADQGADAHTLAAVELCVSEAVSNAVVHAYRKLGGRGPVEVEARRPDGYLCIYVRDRGSGVRRRAGQPRARPRAAAHPPDGARPRRPLPARRAAPRC